MTWSGFSLSQITIQPGHFLSPLCSIMTSPEHFVIMQHSTHLLVCLFTGLIVSLPTNRLVLQRERSVLFYLMPRTVAAIECSIHICPISFILKENICLVNTPIKPLLFHVIFTTNPREMYSEGVKIMVSTVIQLGLSPCSIVYQLWVNNNLCSLGLCYPVSE